MQGELSTLKSEAMQRALVELRARGVEMVFRSERYKVKSQGNYYILRPAAPCG